MEVVMKGIISNIDKSKITMKDGTEKDKFTISFEGDSKKYESWSCSHKVGDEVDGDVSEREWNGKTFYSIKFSGGGFKGGGGFQSRGKSPEELKQQLRSFAAAYAKDVTVSLINQARIKEAKEIDATLLHFFNFFKGVLEA
jgi:hypothetical protein